MFLGRALLLVVAGVSAWLSFGTVSVVNLSTMRVGVLPSVWLLAALVIVGAASAALWRVPVSALAPLALTILLWLPWLPFPVPAAFLIWSGPIELFVWAAAIGGVIAAAVSWRLPATVTRLLGNPQRAPAMALVIGVVCALAGAKALDTRIPNGDEPHYLIISQSLLLDGDLRIENNHHSHDYLPYYADLPRPDFMQRGVDGEIYSIHAPGLPALVAPAFAIDGYRGVVIFVALLVAFGGALAWHAAWMVSGSAAAAWMGWAAVFFSGPVFFHAFTVYPDGVGALCAMAAVWLLVRLEVDATPISRGVLVAVGTGLATLPWLHSRFVLVAAGFGLAVLLRLSARTDRLRAAAAFLVVPACAAIAWFGYFWTIYGTFSPAAPYGNVVQNRLATLKPGLPGIFFDQQFGLVTNAPIFAMALVGLIALARHRPRLVSELALVAIPYVLAVASYVMWWAGQSAPGRFLTILLLPAAIPVGWLFQQTDRLWARALIVASALVGALFVVLRTAVNSGRMVYNVRDGHDLLLDWLSPAVNLPLAFPSFHRDVVAAALRDTLTWTAAMTMVVVVMWAVTRRADRSRGVVWTLTGGTLATAVMVASVFAWMRHEESRIITPGTSQLAFMQEWNPAWHPTTLQIAPLAILGDQDVLPRLELQSSNRGPRPAANRPLVQMPLVPAGEYELVVSGAGRLAGSLDVSVGRSTQTIERFDLTNRQAGLTGLTLRLPVLVDAITIRGDATASAVVSSIALRPLSVRRPADRLTGTYARRASRYGAARVFFLDEHPFMELPGFWTAGAAATSVVVDFDEGAPRTLQLRAGAVSTKVSLTAGEWRAAYDLTAGQVQMVELPGPRAAHALVIETSAAFTPAKLDPASSDLRELGVWVELGR